MSNTRKGLSNDANTGNNIYLQIFNGKFSEKVKADTPGAISRVNKEGNTVHELHYTGLKGNIINVSMTDEKYGKELHITVNFEGEKYVIQMPASSGYAYGFLVKCPLIDFAKPVELRPYAIEDKENKKMRYYFVVYQDGTKVPAFFTKDNPGNLPELKQVKVKGVMQWDDTERLEFFSDMVYDDIVPVLIEMYGSAEEKSAQDSAPGEQFQDEPTDEELSATDKLMNEPALTDAEIRAGAAKTGAAKVATKKGGKK